MEAVLSEFEHSVHVERVEDLPERISELLEQDLLGDLSDSRSPTAHSSLENVTAYAVQMAAGAATLAALKLTAGAFLSIFAFSWAAPVALLALSGAALLHRADIKRTGGTVMATTHLEESKEPALDMGRTIWHEAFHRLTPWSRAVIRIEEGWHRLPLGALAQSELIAKSLGLLLWPFATKIHRTPHRVLASA